MRISTRGRYSMRIMLELAKNYYKNDNLVMDLKKITKAQKLSVKYMEHIISGLKKAGLVLSERGIRGGYKLSMPPEKISLYHIFNATEKVNNLVNCLQEKTTCGIQKTCAAYDIWEGLRKTLINYLKSKDLKELLRIHESKTKSSFIPK